MVPLSLSAPWPFQDTAEHSSHFCKVTPVEMLLAFFLFFWLSSSKNYTISCPPLPSSPHPNPPAVYCTSSSEKLWIKKDSWYLRILLLIQYAHTFPLSPAELHFLENGKEKISLTLFAYRKIWISEISKDFEGLVRPAPSFMGMDWIIQGQIWIRNLLPALNTNHLLCLIAI